MTARHQPAAGDSTADGLVRASEADIDVLSQVIADAFLALAPCRWLIPDGTVRRADLPRLLPAVRRARHRPTGWSTPPRIASPPRCGFPAPGRAEPPGGYDGAAGRRHRSDGPTVPGLRRGTGRHHPVASSHHHLAILAVRPDRQGRGIGTALLDAHHAVLDHEGTAAYLEASDERTRRIYLRTATPTTEPYSIAGRPAHVSHDPRASRRGRLSR